MTLEEALLDILGECVRDYYEETAAEVAALLAQATREWYHDHPIERALQERADALTDAADRLRWMEEVQNVDTRGIPSNRGEVLAEYEAALEDPAEWLESMAQEILEVDE